jgi:outer membrane protein insertion porin family
MFRGERSIYGIDFFVSSGAFLLANDRELTLPARNLSGAALIPIDLTANVGFRMDTKVGGFQFAFSNLFGFIPPLNAGGR